MWPSTPPPSTSSAPRPSSSRPVAPGEWLNGYLVLLAGPIYAGTNEIQRNVVAERLLGLPRASIMDFAFTEEQEALREGVRIVLDTECSPDALRGLPAGRRGGPRCAVAEPLGRAGRAGAPALVVPESADGLGLSDVDLVGVLEEAGRAGLPEPLWRPPRSWHPPFRVAPRTRGGRRAGGVGARRRELRLGGST